MQHTAISNAKAIELKRIYCLAAAGAASDVPQVATAIATESKANYSNLLQLKQKVLLPLK